MRHLATASTDFEPERGERTQETKESKNSVSRLPRYAEIVEGTAMETVALGVLGEKLLAEARSASSGRYGVTIHGGHVHSLRQTLIGVAAGHVLEEHENTGEVTLHMIRGRARVIAGPHTAELAPSDYVVIPLEWDSFEALEDTVVLLTATVRGTPD